MVVSLRDNRFIRLTVDVFRNNHVNFLVTSFLIIAAAYVTLIAIFSRNFVHPLTDNIQSSVDEQQTNSINSVIATVFSIYFLLVTSLCVGKLFQYFSLPPLLGCLLVGVLVRNIHVLNEIVEVHPKWEWCIRMLALTVIIIRCGISLSWDHLEEAMAITLSLGFLTAVVESAAIAIAAIFLLEWSVPIALICGFVLTAVSPAVVVPVMLELRNRGLGTRKGIPTLIMASTTLDNVFCITAFSVATTISFSSEPLFEIIGVTVAELVIGVLIGLFVGWILWWFPISYVVNSSVCRTLLLATVTSATVLGGNVLGFSSAGIVSATLICFVAGVRWKTDNDDKLTYEEKAFSLLWDLFFMPLLFVLIGMKFDFSTMTWTTVLTGCALIAIGAVTRFFAGIVFSFCSEYSMKEQLVIALSLVPKATVQAALAPSITALAVSTTDLKDEIHTAGTACILTILLTAPLGQYVLTKLAPILLKNNRVVGIAKSSIEDMHYIGKTSNGITGIGIKATKLDDAIQSQRF